MKNKIFYLFLVFAIAATIFMGQKILTQTEYIKQSSTIQERPIVWNETIAKSINELPISFNVDGKEMYASEEQVYMDNSLSLMIPVDMLSDAFNCAVNFYDNKTLVIEKNSVKLQLDLESYSMDRNGETVSIAAPLRNQSGRLYISTDAIIKGLGYQYSWDIENNVATLVNVNPDGNTLPYYYSYADEGRLPIPKNQGRLGTCWAFASLTALETTLLPEETFDFSEDHMSLHNSYGISQNDGGEYTMAIAYLASWQGPVLEQDDPYGDGISTDNLPAVKHVQEVQIIDSKDFETIKNMVYKYGGVQSSLYTSLKNSSSQSIYYNSEKYAYCYLGEEKPNHDVVIVGWDDNYPKENFNANLEGDGAFICRNSWGDEFGDNGNFYVSYYDSNIGIHNVVYTKVEDASNYDNIYQSDLCGWVGHIGYQKDYGYFANVYEAKSNEELEAVSFYATGKDTQYSVYICENFDGAESLNNRSKKPIAQGKLTNAGYYTIPVQSGITLQGGQKYAVIVKITTPNSLRPIAIEYAADEQSANVDISDGEGYISQLGDQWQRVEDTENCNICLKAFTNKVE